MGRWSLVLCLPLALSGCAVGSFDLAYTGGTTGDAGPVLPPPGTGGTGGTGGDVVPGVDGGVGTPPSTPSQGTITFERRNFEQATGRLGSPTPAPLRGATVELLMGETVVETTRTNETGGFNFNTTPIPGTHSLRARADSQDHGPVQVSDFQGAIYAARSELSATPFNMHIPEASSSGAFAIQDTMRFGEAYARGAFGMANNFGTLRVHWVRGQVTPGQTSYFDGDLWILGGPDDTDEYDVPVLLHELGHFIQSDLSFGVDTWNGDAHAGVDTDPRAALQEGWATFFGLAAMGNANYWDTVSNEGYPTDYGMPLDSSLLANPSGGMNQTLAEDVIISSLWRILTTSGDLNQATNRLFRVPTDWIAANRGDRGFGGRDLVDFLDGLLCLHSQQDASAVQQAVVTQNRFPYDMNPQCKPGSTCRPTQLIDVSDVPVDGELVMAPDGVRLREIRIDRAVVPPLDGTVDDGAVVLP